MSTPIRDFFLSSTLGAFSSPPPLQISYFSPPLSFWIHDFDSPLHGHTTVIFVPLRRELVISNSPPICATRSRIPLRPTPHVDLDFESVAVITKFQTKFFRPVANRVKGASVAYLSVLVNASCPMCRRFFLPRLGKLGQSALRLKL